MIRIKSTSLQSLRNELEAMQVNVPKEMRIAAWKAQKRGRNEVAKRLSKEIRQPAKRLKGASYAKMLTDESGFTFIIRDVFRIAVKRFKPKRTANGMKYKVGQKWNEVPGAFNTTRRPPPMLYAKTISQMKRLQKRSDVHIPIAKLNGTPVKRVGKSRLPIKAVPAVKLVKEIRDISGLVGNISDLLGLEFKKQVIERLRYLKVKLSGKLRNQK